MARKTAVESKKSKIKEILLNNKVITRNQALSMGITRLGAIIDELKNSGYAIEGYWLNDKSDYAYKLVGITPVENSVKTTKKVLLTNFENLAELEEWVTNEANKLKAKGAGEVVLINVFEPVLNILSNIFSMPKRNIVMLSSQKQAHIDKVSFPIMSVYESIKNMFYENNKKSYLKNRIERIINKYKNKNANTEDGKDVIFIIYGLKDNDERDIKFFTELLK